MSVPLQQKAYQAFGDLILEFEQDAPSGYRRELDLDTAAVSMEYTDGGVHYRRKRSPVGPINCRRAT